LEEEIAELTIKANRGRTPSPADKNNNSVLNLGRTTILSPATNETSASAAASTWQSAVIDKTQLSSYNAGNVSAEKVTSIADKNVPVDRANDRKVSNNDDIPHSTSISQEHCNDTNSMPNTTQSSVDNTQGSANRELTPPATTTTSSKVNSTSKSNVTANTSKVTRSASPEMLVAETKENSEFVLSELTQQFNRVCICVIVYICCYLCLTCYC
jgi:hypothetical protein